jgi:hypothetical protein
VLAKGFSVDLRRCQLLGLTGSVVLALGGETAGALPVRELPALASGRAALGLVGVYFGVVLLIAAWGLLGRVIRGPEPPSPRALLVVLAVWATPLLLAPPLFSRDVYSYLAQGAMVDAHIDVYTHGPAMLGGPLADEVAPVWQRTATPYGPVFLAVSSALSGLTRGEVPAGLFGMRVVALLGVALMAAALPRLARHSGADPAAALWLGALNPLVLLHLVAGAHNDAIMLGLLGVGLVAALGPVAGPGRRTRHARRPRQGPRRARPRRRRGPPGAGRPQPREAVATTAAAALATTVAATAAAGTGYGWIGALKTPVSPENLSPTSVLGRATGALLQGPRQRPRPLRPARLARPRPRGHRRRLLAIWLRSPRLSPVYALGLSLAAVAVLGPAIRPWYALWGLFLIAAAAPSTSVRHRVAAVTGALALAVLPSGSPPDAEQLALAVSGGMLALVVLWQAHQTTTAPVLGRTA